MKMNKTRLAILATAFISSGAMATQQQAYKFEGTINGMSICAYGNSTNSQQCNGNSDKDRGSNILIGTTNGGWATGNDSTNTVVIGDKASAITTTAGPTKNSSYATAVGGSSQAGQHGTGLGYSSYAGSQSVAVGSATGATGVGSIAIGYKAGTQNLGNPANGKPEGNPPTGTKTGDYSVSLGHSSHAGGKFSVAIGYGSTATEYNVVSVGSDINQRRITNVAEAVKDNDVVNLGQVRKMLANAGGVEAVNNLDHKLTKTTKELKAGIAGAMAMSGIPQVMTAGKSMLGASVGTYQGQNALAVGYSHSTDNGKTVFKLQASVNTEKELGGSVGIGYQW